MPALNPIVELVREKVSGDGRFWRSMGYVFELITNPMAPGVPGGRIVFPMVLAPTGYSYTDTFSVEATETLGSNLIVEESGIIRGQITLDFDFGFDVKSGDPDTALPPVPMGVLGMSGHAHYMRVRNVLFHRYSELKKDSRFAADTRLVLHVLKDDDHFVVVPEEFSMRRERTTYPWSVRLIVTGEAGPLLYPTKSALARMLSTFEEVVNTVRNGAAMARAAINDVTGLLDRARLVFAAVDSVVNDVGGILDAVDDFTAGRERFIASRRNTIQNVVATVEDLINAFGDSGQADDDDLVAVWEQVQDGLHRVAAFPEAFAAPFDERLSRLQPKQITASEASEAADMDAPSSVTELGTTGVTAGDAIRALEQSGQTVRKYTGATSVVIRHGDSLTALAAHYIGDPGAWEDIAIVNELRAPYIAESALPGVLRPGDTILIPTFGEQTPRRNATGGPGFGETSEDALLGTDFALVEGGGARDLVVDVARGSTDVKYVAGVSNLAQGVGVRVDVEQGTCRVIPELGVVKLVGYPNSHARIVDAEYKVRDSVSRDSRIERILSSKFESDGDAVRLELSAEMTGSIGTREIEKVIT